MSAEFRDGVPPVTIRSLMSTRLTATARREQILDIALEVFATHGFHGASMNDVADAVGVTKPVLYQHFDSKRDLYQALIDEVGERLLPTSPRRLLTPPTARARPNSGFAPTSGGSPKTTTPSGSCSARARAATTSSTPPSPASPPRRPRRSPR